MQLLTCSNTAKLLLNVLERLKTSLSCFSEYYWCTEPQSVIMIRIFARILYKLLLLANYPQTVILCVSSEQAFKKLPKDVYIAILCLNCNFRRFQFCGHQNMPVQMTPGMCCEHKEPICYGCGYF